MLDEPAAWYKIWRRGLHALARVRNASVKGYIRMSGTKSAKSFGGEVDHRAQQLLKLLVEHYISDGTVSYTHLTLPTIYSV